MSENYYVSSPHIVDTEPYFLYYNILVTFVLPYAVGADKQGRAAMAEKEVLIDWIKKHKKKLILAGVSVPVILALIIEIKNRDEIIKALKSLIKLADETSQKVTDPTIFTNLDDMSIQETIDFNASKVEANLIDVCSHIRNLHEGWTPSEEKVESAVQMGYELNPNQTWVKKYTKRKFVA